MIYISILHDNIFPTSLHIFIRNFREESILLLIYNTALFPISDKKNINHIQGSFSHSKGKKWLI